jgi:signal transduction histidine kinase
VTPCVHRATLGSSIQRRVGANCGTEITRVRTRIIGLAVFASIVAIGLFGIPLGVAVLQYFAQSERSELARVADAIAITVAADLSVGDRIDDHVRDINARGAVTVTVYDASGDWVGGARPPEPGPELTEALAGRMGTATGTDDVVVAVPVTHVDEVIGAVRVVAPGSAVLRRVAPAWGAMAGLGLLAVGAAWLVGRRQARRLALPLEDLAVAARRLGDGDFSVRTRQGGIEEIDSVGRALDSTAGRLDELLARERAFSADASHQLRTPLAGLRLRLEAALERPDEDPRPAIAASLVDADRLEATIQELLTLARERSRAAAEPVDVGALIGELSPEWRGRLALQGRDLSVRTEPGTPDPCASPAAVRQVLAVLVDNAMTHGKGTVSVRVRETTGAVAIDVADEGTGIHEPAHLAFARRDDHRGGHGIGLALARRLAEAEHGRLELTRASPPVFTLLLPPSADEDASVHGATVGGTGDGAARRTALLRRAPGVPADTHGPGP